MSKGKITVTRRGRDDWKIIADNTDLSDLWGLEGCGSQAAVMCLYDAVCHKHMISPGMMREGMQQVIDQAATRAEYQAARKEIRESFGDASWIVTPQRWAAAARSQPVHPDQMELL